MYISLHVKYLLFVPDFNEILIFSTDFRKKKTEIKFHGNPSVEAGRSMGTDRRIDGHDENSRFSKFYEGV